MREADEPFKTPIESATAHARTKMAEGVPLFFAIGAGLTAVFGTPQGSILLLSNSDEYRAIRQALVGSSEPACPSTCYGSCCRGKA